ncbi:MAG: hypothetical protein JXA13_11625 [Anaerolineales bacterium]|nr:hypothetical protein [Anaerolineales bacterium]
MRIRYAGARFSTLILGGSLSVFENAGDWRQMKCRDAGQYMEVVWMAQR